MVLNIADVSAQKKKQLIAAGKWFPFQGKVFPSQAARAKAQAASTKVVAPKKGTKQVGKTNTSSLFWSAYPGPRENVPYVFSMEKTPAQLAVGTPRGVLIKGGATTTYGMDVSAAAFPSNWEVTGLGVRFECGLMPRDVVVQVAFLLAKSVASLPNLTWKQVTENPACRVFQDVRSVNQAYKLKVDRPINSGSDTAGAYLVVMTRAVDSDTPTTDKVKIEITVTLSQLKATSSTLDL